MRRKTQEEYEAQIKEKAPHIIVRGKYSGNRTKIEHYCLKHKVAWDVSPFNFLQHPNGCRECQKEVLNRFIDTRRKSDEQFKNEVVALGTGIVPMGEYIGNRDSMPFMCNLGHVWISTPHDVLEGYGCPYCSGQRILIGFNDLWTTDPEIAAMLCDPKVGYEVSRGSNKEVEWICKYCGKHKFASVKQVITYGLGCIMCSDSISYPNKFIRALLSQFDECLFIPEWNPEWAGKYKYDIYLVYNNREYIVEMDGGIGHGCIDFKTGNKDTNGLYRDTIKDQLAKEHNIEVIRIDCDYKDIKYRFEYIKQSTLNSKISKIFDLSFVDWDKCNKEALKNLHMEAAKLYESGLSIRDISIILRVSYSSVYNWLKTLSKNGLCSYNPEDGIKKKRKNKIANQTRL